MEGNWLKRTKYIAVRVNESAFDRLQAVADADRKPLGEWCRDALIAVARRRQPSPFQFGLLAEMTATQAIVTPLLCTVGRDGKVSTQKAQEIVDKANDEKYQEALDLLMLAQTKGKRFRWTVPPTISNQEERDE